MFYCPVRKYRILDVAKDANAVIHNQCHRLWLDENSLIKRKLPPLKRLEFKNISIPLVRCKYPEL